MRVLALSPHTDDVEFGAGATLSRLVRDGAEVYSLALSACERSVPEGSPPDVLRGEFAAAMDALGVTDHGVHDFPVRGFPSQRQRVLDLLVEARKQISPDLVLCPALSDTHQDHRVVAEECVRAFRGVTTLGYVLPWNCPTVSVCGWREVFDADVDRKLRALSCYRSQAGRPYATESAVRAHLVTAGLQSGRKYAEPFEVIRWVS